MMTFAPFNGNTYPIFYELELLKVQDMIKTQQLTLFDFHQSCLPDNPTALFHLTAHIHTINVVLVYIGTFYTPLSSKQRHMAKVQSNISVQKFGISSYFILNRRMIDMTTRKF